MNYHTPKDELLRETLRLDELANRYASEPAPDGEEDGEDDAAFERTLPDLTWLAAVTVLLSDRLGGDTATAIEIVKRNRENCLSVRSDGFLAWEVAAYAASREE